MGAIGGGVGGGMLGTLFVRLTADATGLHRGMKQAEATVAKTSSEIGRHMAVIAKASTLALGAIGVLSVREFAKFDKAMVESLAIMGDLNEGIKKEMADTARAIARDGVKTAEELARSYFFLASAGLSAEQSIGALPLVTKFATAGAFDMALATDLLTDAQSALGLSVKDTAKNIANMSRISDVLVKANTLANATVLQFSESLTNKAGAALRIVNKDVEEGVAVLAAFADQGLKGSAAGEALNIVMRDMQRTALKSREEFAAMGITVFDSSGNMRNMADIVEDLEGVLEGMSDEQKRATFTLLGFQDRSLSATMALLGTSQKIRDYEKALRDAGGTTDDVANRQLQSFSNQLTITKNKLKDIAITIGEALAPSLLGLNGHLADLTESLRKAEEEAFTITSTIAAIVAVVKTMGLGVATIYTALKSLATIISTSVTLVLEILMREIGAVIGIFRSWWIVVQAIGSALAELGRAIGLTGEAMIAFFKRDFDKAAQLATEARDKIGTAFSELGKDVAGEMKVVATTVADATAGTWSVAAALIKDANADLAKQWLDLVDTHERLFNDVEKKGAETAEAVKTSWSPVATVFWGAAHAIEAAKNSLAELIKADLAIPQMDLEKLSEAMKGPDRGFGIGAEGFGMQDVGDPATSQAFALKADTEGTEKNLALLEEAGEAELAAINMTNEQKLKAIEAYNERLKELQLAQTALILGSSSQMFDDLAGMVASFGGRQSAAYKAMFAASKAFAIAEATVKIAQGIANAASLGWPLGIIAMAQVVAATASIVSSIQSVKLEFSGEKREKGGPVRRSRTYLVGEKGPELFTPEATGHIIPNQFLPDRNARASFIDMALIQRAQLKDIIALTQAGENDVLAESAEDSIAMLDRGRNSMSPNRNSAFMPGMGDQGKRVSEDLLRTLRALKISDDKATKPFLLPNNIIQVSAAKEMEQRTKSAMKPFVLPDRGQSAANIIRIHGSRETGGQVTRGQNYIIGERGPEKYVPADQRTSSSEGDKEPSVRVVINNYTDAKAEVNERQEGDERVLEVMIRRIKSDITSEIRDGRGDVTKAMESSFNLRRGQQ